MPVTAASQTGTPRDTATLPGLKGLDVQGKRVILRVDYNISQNPDGTLYDDYRIASTLPTIQRLLSGGARVGILTHRGRPGGRVVPELSTKPLAAILSGLLGQPVEHVPDCVGRIAEQAMAELAPGQIVMLENVRFHLGEQMNQHSFVQQLAALGDVFVNDAFASAHRAHASTSGLAGAMDTCVIGELMERELMWLRRLKNNPDKPILLVLGGNNVESKIELLRQMLTKVDTVMLGGAIANTFMAARDLGLGQSLLDPTYVDAARDLLTEAGVVGCRLHLPQDVMVRNASAPTAPAEVRPAYAIGAQESVIDIGPATLATWQRLVVSGGTTMLLGSLGITEHPEGRTGTLGLVKTLTDRRGFSLVGGNGLLPMLQDSGLRELLPALSTGGAALVGGLIGRPLPSVDVMF